MRTSAVIMQQVLLAAILLLAVVAGRAHAPPPAATCAFKRPAAVNLTAVYIAVGTGLEINFGVSHGEGEAESCCSQCLSSDYNPPGDIRTCVAWLAVFGNPTGNGPACVLMNTVLPASATSVKADHRNVPGKEPVNSDAVAGIYAYGVIARHKNFKPLACTCPALKSPTPKKLPTAAHHPTASKHLPTHP